MGLRYFHRMRVLPGLRLNFSRSGISTSVGRRGLWVTYGRRGRRTTVELPRTGIYCTNVSKLRGAVPARSGSGVGLWLLWLLLALAAGAYVASR